MSKNTSKNRLFPFAVLDTIDLRIEIGHESPKQKIVNASNKSVIPAIVIITLRSAAFGGTNFYLSVLFLV